MTEDSLFNRVLCLFDPARSSIYNIMKNCVAFFAFCIPIGKNANIGRFSAQNEYGRVILFVTICLFEKNRKKFEKRY